MSGGIRGYASSQKLVQFMPDGLPEYATLEPQDAGLRAGLDVISRGGYRVSSKTSQAGTGNPSSGGPTEVADTGTLARVGDFIKFTSGVAVDLELPIVAVTTNAMQLGVRVVNPPAPGDTFAILRYTTPRYNQDGSFIVSVSPAVAPSPIGFARIACSVTTITSAAYVTLIASVASNTQAISISNDTGKAFILAFGAAASEVDKFYVPPNNGFTRQDVLIPGGTRLSLKATVGPANSGEVLLNLFG